MSANQILEKLDQLTNMLNQIIEFQKHSQLLPLVEQITTLGVLFEKIPDLIRTTRSIDTEEIVAELKDISTQLETLNPEKDTTKGKEKLGEEIYSDVWP